MQKFFLTCVLLLGFSCACLGQDRQVGPDGKSLPAAPQVSAPAPPPEPMSWITHLAISLAAALVAAAPSVGAWLQARGNGTQAEKHTAEIAALRQALDAMLAQQGKAKP